MANYDLNNLQDCAKLVLQLTDLTSLGDNDTDQKIKDLCAKAISKEEHAAAVCVFPKFLGTATKALKDTDVRIATVVNFPKGEFDLEKTLSETKEALDNGAQEIDLVFPYRQLMHTVAAFGQWNEDYTDLTAESVNLVAHDCFIFVKAVADLVHERGALLKVILETGELSVPYLIILASNISIEAGADFLKTSTGKSTVSATFTACKLMLESIARSQKPVGFKASGGISTVEVARQIILLAISIFGPEYINQRLFRFGASSIFADIEHILETGKSLEQDKEESAY